MIDYSNLGQRLKVIQAIKDEQNTDRKARSLKECEIYNDDIRPYVLDYLRTRFSAGTVSEMPIIASINLSQKIVNQEASIYKNPPKRTFTNLTDEQHEVALKIYEDMLADSVFLQANRFYRLQKQTHVKIFPMKGKLMMKNYKNHQLDAEPDMMMPEYANGYIFSGFDKFFGVEDRTYQDSDGVNSVIGDEEDYEASTERYVVWAPEVHFVMNGHGEILTEETENPLGELTPVIDISTNKDNEYFVSYGNALSDFAVEFNGHLSSLAHVVDLQGFSQCVIKGDPDLIPKNLTVGPNHIIYLPVNKDQGIDSDFEFASPNSDIQGSQSFVESLLSMFLSSRGVDPKTISGTANGEQAFSSGIERLLSMIEKFEASREDLSLFEKVEQRTWELVKAWHNVLRDTDQLDDKYKTIEFPEDSEVIVGFSSPELVQTDKEKLEAIELKLNLGLISQRMAVGEFHDTEDEDKIDEIMEEIEGEMDADNKEKDELLSRPEQETGGFIENPENES
jgi:hypothetical protein